MRRVTGGLVHRQVELEGVGSWLGGGVVVVDKRVEEWMGRRMD